jgi:hypothetical protein
VNYARSGHRADAGHLGITSQESIDHRAIQIASTGVYDQSGRLVHDDDLVVLVNDRQGHRAFSSGHTSYFTFQPIDYQLLTGPDLPGSQRPHNPIHVDRTSVYGRTGPVATHVK